jgi:hypothetical protein
MAQIEFALIIFRRSKYPGAGVDQWIDGICTYVAVADNTKMR